MRIMTGAPLPEGANAVAMVEETRAADDGASVRIERRIQVGDFVRRPGRDVAAGDVIARTGAILTPAHLGLLASQAVTSVIVHPRPKVGVLSTGDELFDGRGPLPPGRIRDANRHTLLGLVQRASCQCVDLGIVGDDEDALVDALTHAAEDCDAIITSGGVSVGDFDIVRIVLERMSAGSMRWMQIAIRPAKPFAFGMLAGSGTPVFGLPGNPVSAMVSFELLARPALRLLAGHKVLHRPTLSAVAQDDVVRQPDGKLHLLRAWVTLDRGGVWRVSMAAGQESDQLHAMATANGLALLPDGRGVGAGDQVDVLLLDPDTLDNGTGSP
jgi:molybdenum cofactor synthesis domain-containing protein